MTEVKITGSHLFARIDDFKKSWKLCSKVKLFYVVYSSHNDTWPVL